MADTDKETTYKKKTMNRAVTIFLLVIGSTSLILPTTSFSVTTLKKAKRRHLWMAKVDDDDNHDETRTRRAQILPLKSTQDLTKMKAEEAVKQYRQSHYSHGDAFVALLVTKGLQVGVSDQNSLSKEEFHKVTAPNLVDRGGFDMDADNAIHTNTRRVRDNSFIKTAVEAFSHHYPFALRPQHIWILILQAIADHVNQNAEEVRSKWVKHNEGKKTLVVCRDDFVRGEPNDWASVVVNDGEPDSFGAQIRENAINTTQLSPKFTGTATNSVEHIAQQITVMDVCKEYFKYGVYTLCGFPFVVMEGSLDDWKMLRAEAETVLKDRCVEEWASEWSKALLPLLDKFVEEYQAQTKGDSLFWNAMCRKGGIAGSGGYTYLSGWLNVFFPYLNGGSKSNRYCVPYKAEKAYKLDEHSVEEDPDLGPQWTSLPSGLSKAPVTWSYYGQEIPLEFLSGFVGMTFNDGVAKPVVGWSVVELDEKETSPNAEVGRKGLIYRCARFLRWTGLRVQNSRTRDMK